MPFLRVRGTFRSSLLRRLTAAALSGLVVFGVIHPVLSGSSAAASPRRKSRSHSRSHSRSQNRPQGRSVRAAHVRVETAFLRSGPNRKSKATGLLDAGRKARVLERRDGWLKLRLASGTEGWVRADLLTVSKKSAVSEEKSRSSRNKSRKTSGDADRSGKRVASKRPTPRPSKRVALHDSPGTKPKAAPVPSARPTAPSPEVIAAARLPFVRSVTLRPLAKTEPPRPVERTEGSASSERTPPEEVTVEADLPPEMLQSEPVVGDTETLTAENTEADVMPVEESGAADTVDPATVLRSERIVRSALAYRGAPYRLGATGRYGAFDCSAFTRHILTRNGTSLPRTAAEQYHKGTPVARHDLQAGDLVFFKNTYKRGISHVGIYIGNDRFIHASSRRTGVTVSDLNASYYARHYAGARRVR